MARKPRFDYSGSTGSSRNQDGRRWHRGTGKQIRALFCGGTGSLLLWLILGSLSLARAGESTAGPALVLTNISQLRSLPIREYLRGVSFHLTGVVTLVDTNRNLVVLQDATGAMAIDPGGRRVSLRPEQLISIEGSNCSPYVFSFPEYPYRPSGRDVRNSFEAPSNWGDYHLTRMRGLVYPPETGEYTFWIASDNSSELWLSPDADPAKVRRIAFVRQWVGRREWLREPSQRSETILLRAGEAYYLEAFQEQLTVDDHLSVAWQGPGLKQSVVDGRYLTPWTGEPETAAPAATHGILREYWTNYFAGNLVGITGPKPFDSALSAEELRITVLGQGTLPEPRRIHLDQQLPADDRFGWVEVEGTVRFAGNDGETALLELTDGRGQAQVRFLNRNGNWPTNSQSWRVRVRGVCEGVRNSDGLLTPGLIWAFTGSNLTFVESVTTNRESLTGVALNPLAPTNNSAALGGFSVSYGTVTFNDRVLGRDYLFVQVDSTAIFISQEERRWGNQVRVGQWVEVGGELYPGNYNPSLRPLTLRVIDWHSMPEPVDAALAGNKDGSWTELEGVVRAVNPDGVLTLMGKRGAASVWLGHVSTNALEHFIDATLRVRGVMSLALPEGPLLLVPSRNFVHVEEEPTADPFAIPARGIAALETFKLDVPRVHRVKVAGVVTYRNDRTLFVQDESGGARVQTSEDDSAVQIGEVVEVVGFPEIDRLLPTLVAARLRPTGQRLSVRAEQLDASDGAAGGHGGRLIRMRASLVSRQAAGGYELLELQDGQRVFDALLATNLGTLQPFQAGSRLEITGVWDPGPAMPPDEAKAAAESSSSRSFRIWLRGPADVVLLNGPPWWTWRRTAALVGTLLAVLVGSVLWIHLLHRRLERQQAAQLAFSRQILQSQESERRRIAANLHDGLGQNLLVIKNQARLAMQPVKEESVRQSLAEISRVAAQAIEEVRQITHGLRPYQLDRLGLTQAIRAAINSAAGNSPIVFASDVEDIDGVFDRESEIHIYRIVQECINNIVKHSGATEATVVIKRQAGIVSLSIRDNGRGFDAGALPSGPSDTGFGLSGISERLRILGGVLTMDSRPGEGANLRIEIKAAESRNETRSATADRG